jgi:peptide/nickel transport system substrate-binding protein
MWKHKFNLLIAMAVSVSLVAAIACAAEEAAAPAAPKAAAAAAAAATAVPAAAASAAAPAAPSAAAAAAPAAAASAAAKAAPAAAAVQAAAAAAAAARAAPAAGGSSYIGPYNQGVDPATYPTYAYSGPTPSSWQERPQYVQQVAAGKLPKLADRVPVVADRFIAGPLWELGVYGGTYRTTSSYMAAMQVQVPTYITKEDTPGDIRLTWLPAEITNSSDGKVWTIRNRKNLHHSNGRLVTMDDVSYAILDIDFNKEYMPNPSGSALDPVTGNPFKFATVDDLTWTITFDTGNYDFLKGNPFGNGTDCISWCFMTDSTYSKQFHKKYADPVKLQEMMDKGNFSSWVKLHKKMHDARRIVDFPWQGPMTVCAAEERRREICANPYFFGFDPAGNQLPYVDKWVDYFAESREVAIFKHMQGETDFQSAGLDIQEFPLYKSNMVKGDYSVYMWPNPHGTNQSIAFNQSYNEDPALGKLVRTTAFRQALAYAIDREAIRDTYFIGVGRPTAGAPNPKDGFYPGDAVANKFSVTDLAKANTMLDGLGLTDSDGDGIRNYAGGGNVVLWAELNSRTMPLWELVVSDFKNVGIQLDIKEGANHNKMRTAEQPIGADGRVSITEASMTGVAPCAASHGPHNCPLIGKYIATGGKQGHGPVPNSLYLPTAPAGAYPEDATGVLKQVQDLYKTAKSNPPGSATRLEAGKKMNTLWMEQQFTIGTVQGASGDRDVYMKRNNFRNPPILARARGFYGAWAETYYFEDGKDNVNNPGNRSKKYKSTSFR